MVAAHDLSDRDTLLQQLADLQHEVTQLRGERDLFRTVATFSYDWAFWQAPSGAWLYCSPSCQRITGRSVDEFLANPAILHQMIHPDDRRMVAQFIGLKPEDIPPLTVTFRIIRPDGEIRWIEHNCQAVYDGSGRFIGRRASSRDVTERKQAEEAVRRSEERFRLLVEQAADGIFVANAQRRYIDVNSAGCQMLGYTREELLRLKIDDVVADEEVPRAAGEPSRLSDGNIIRSEWRMRRKDRSTFIGEVTARQLPDGRLQAILRDITQRKQDEEQLKAINETLERRVAERTAEAEHRADQLQALAAQMTQVEQSERRRLAQILHDHLQQLLVAARLQLAQAHRHTRDPSLGQAIDRIDNLLEQSITESRSLTSQLSPPVLYDRGLAAGLEWLGRQTQEKYGLDTDVETDPRAEPAEEGIKVFLFQATRELLLNVAKHAQATRAWVRLSHADGQITVEVRDNGVGFDLARLPDRKPSGFGMFSIRERIELLGGRMEVASSPGQGARVLIRVPAGREIPRAQRVPHAALSTASALPDHGRIRVLLADDHPILRKGLADVLRDQPEIEVVGEACDGKEAVELARQLRPDVILMDVTMPRLSGVEATREITAEQPGVHVIGLSMHEGADMAAAMEEAGTVCYLRKDVPLEDLIAVILQQVSQAQAVGG